jgi:predicted AAA+ superfamily ATPase
MCLLEVLNFIDEEIMHIDLLKQIICDEQSLALPLLTARDLKLVFVPEMALTIVGARRCGKSYRTLQYVRDLVDKGLKRENVCRVLFNDHRLINIPSDQLHCIDNAYYSLYPEKRRSEKVVFVFDEIHRIAGWEDYILYLLAEPNHAVLITGSTSRLLSGNIASALRGKNFPVNLWPFSFSEFIRHHGVDSDVVSTGGQVRLRNMFSRYISQGGFPGLLNAPESEYRRLLQTYWDTMVLRDVIEAHADANINISAFNALVSELISRVGCPMTIKRVMACLSERGISCGINSLYQYLAFMREAFMLETVEFYSPSEKIRHRNYRKVYCVDWALANAVAPGAGIDITRQLENMIYVELRRRNCRVSYFRTRNDYEIDFVATSASDNSISLIQVAWSLDKPEVLEREVRALVSSAEYLNADDIFIITNDDEKVIKCGAMNIKVLPAWKWLVGL